MRSRRFSFPRQKVSRFQGFEKTAIRIVAVCTVLLGLYQLKAFTDPVEFYLKFSGEIDAPAFKYSENANSGSISLSFEITPDSVVMVRQNDQDIGTIENGKSITVEPGTVVLDATGIPYPVTVNVILNSKTYSIELNGDVKSFDVKLKSAEAS
ncbi:hypothetical protein [Dehalobacter restrictus]|uniref:Uncharacterized protein n=1 Tax=Dehalobacter restrictus TaxID=55583 RepID=A0A857DIU5_9FIRM|nr:hypothetical protein [Dehalobacter restrictus]QHA00867.1 hypothetical protein GQ588_09595 [Dehalobacter restrictus]